VKVLVACEFSGTVRDAFRKLGHDAWSCDLRPDKNGSPFHIQGDALEAVKIGWDLLIAHPPCPYLTGSAEWAYGDGPYHQKVKPGTLVGAARRAARDEAAEFFMAMYNAPVERVAVENPVGCMSRRFRKPDQIIQPYEFGSDASKKTCLWLRGLPKLKANEYVQPRLVTPWIPCPDECGDYYCTQHRKHVADCSCPSIDSWASRNLFPYEPCLPRWSNQTDSGQNRLSPSEDREAIRSVTYPGVAKAMAEQWGGAQEGLEPARQPELLA
jgi:hypothetical protein